MFQRDNILLTNFSF